LQNIKTNHFSILMLSVRRQEGHLSCNTKLAAAVYTFFLGVPA